MNEISKTLKKEDAYINIKKNKLSKNNSIKY